VARVVSATDGHRAGALDVPVDALTGFPGGDSFHERLEDDIRRAAAAGEPLALVLADVDQLRKVGDALGRDAEVLVVRKLAGILRATFRTGDFVARLGDDDFAAILPGLGRGSARQIGARLRSTVERFRFFGVQEPPPAVRITLSIGAATFPADAENADDLLARAREALDEARSLGRNRVWCYTRRPRVPLRAPVYLDGPEPLLLGYSKDLSPSGIFVTTPAPIDIGMRCALSFPLPSAKGNVHVIGRVVRTVTAPDVAPGLELPVPGMGFEFERFGAEDRRAIESFLYENEASTLRPETGVFSTP
jgi:diguanylate cyclase (GGDEF)-like protein